MASMGDLKCAARLAPSTYQQVNAKEREIDQTFVMPSKKHGRRFLDEVTGIPRAPDGRKAA